MNTLKLLLFIISMAPVLLGGCAESEQFKPVEQICLSEVAKDEAMRTAEEVLGQMHFSIAKSDADSGVIITRPLQGAQLFEIWRSDSVGGFNTAEANLHSIRRSAEVKINEEDGQVCIRCDVNTQRLNMPQRAEGSRSQAFKLFSEGDSVLQKLKLQPEQKQGMVWIDLGGDERLSTAILRRIEKKATKLQKENKL